MCSPISQISTTSRRSRATGCRSIVFNSKVVRAHWDDAEYRWHVFTERGDEYVAQFLISGAGALHIPSLPDIPGIADFAGPLFHTAEWDHSVDLTGKKVAVIGTGASAIKSFPSWSRPTAQVQLYQRTAAWIKPRINFAFPGALKRAFALVPGCGRRCGRRPTPCMDSRAVALAKAAGADERRRLDVQGQHAPLHQGSGTAQEADAELQAGLQANPDLGQLLPSRRQSQGGADHRRHRRITHGGIVTVDGTERAVDAIVWRPAFHVTDSYTYVDIKGAGGEDLVDRWNREGVVAHRGVTVADVPNLFFLLGPNTGLGHNSVVFMIESQIGTWPTPSPPPTRRARPRGADPRRPGPVQRKLQDDLSTTVWNTGGCQSWYLDDHGVNRSLWSGLRPVLVGDQGVQAVRVQILRRRSARCCLVCAQIWASATRQHMMLCCRWLSHPRGSVGSGL